MEMSVVFEELLRGLTNIELDGPIERQVGAWDMTVFGGCKRVPLRFESGY